MTKDTLSMAGNVEGMQPPSHASDGWLSSPLTTFSDVNAADTHGFTEEKRSSN